MRLITLKSLTAIEKNDLNRIFEEAKPFFNKVEGRDPIPPIENIESIIPELSNDDCHCMSIFLFRYDNWVLMGIRGLSIEYIYSSFLYK